MVVLSDLTSRDRKQQVESAEKTSNHPAAITHVLGHENRTDLGYEGGAFPGDVQETHSQLCLAGGTQSWGPLRPGVYQFCIGVAAAPFAPGADGVHYKPANDRTDVPDAFDFPMLSTTECPYFEVKLRSGQTHINFVNTGAATIAIFMRRLV